jgi:hypothetical protein
LVQAQAEEEERENSSIKEPDLQGQEEPEQGRPCSIRVASVQSARRVH